MKAFFFIVGTLAMILLMAPFGAALGGVAGWTVGLFFGNSILGTLSSVGVHGVAMWQLGATLGFIGSFFRSSGNNAKN